MTKEIWEYVAFYDGAAAYDLAPKHVRTVKDKSWQNDPARVCECRARKNPNKEKCSPCLRNADAKVS